MTTLHATRKILPSERPPNFPIHLRERRFKSHKQKCYRRMQEQDNVFDWSEGPSERRIRSCPSEIRRLACGGKGTRGSHALRPVGFIKEGAQWQFYTSPGVQSVKRYGVEWRRKKFLGLKERMLKCVMYQGLC